MLEYPGAFPNQGGLPIQVDRQTLGGIGVSGAPSEVDEAICQVAIEALLKRWADGLRPGRFGGADTGPRPRQAGAACAVVLLAGRVQAI